MKRNKRFFTLIITFCLMLNAFPLYAKSESEIPVNYKECEDALTQREINNGFSDDAIMEILEETFGKNQAGENSIYYVGSLFQRGAFHYNTNKIFYSPIADKVECPVWNEDGELIGVLYLDKYYDYADKKYDYYLGCTKRSDMFRFLEIAEDSKKYALLGIATLGLGGTAYSGYVLIDEEDNMTILGGSLYDEEYLEMTKTDRTLVEKAVEEMTFEKYSFGENVISKDTFILDRSTAMKVVLDKTMDITLSAGIEDPLPANCKAAF